MRVPFLIASILLLGNAPVVHADSDPARVADVQVKRDSEDQAGIFHIRVTIEHEDEGWDDYVETWEIVGPDGTVFGARPFFEPASEGPTTITALSGVIIPEDVKTVTVRARTYPDGEVSEPFEIDIPH